MSQHKRRSRQWKGQEAKVMNDLTARIGRHVRRLKQPSKDLLQEGYLAIWRMSPDEVAEAANPVLRQRMAGEAAMRRFARYWDESKEVEVISLDKYLEEEEPLDDVTEDEWGAPVRPRRKAA